MAIKTPQGSVVGLPRGTNDFNARDSILMKEIISIAEEIFKRYGFSPIITPSIENTAVLNAKAYGDETTKEMYLLEGGDAALRFDLTVPLARFMAMNKDIPLPFKRYQIGTVWRKDEPQKMRDREFMQADVDIVGSKDLQSDAECIAAMTDAIRAIGIRNFTVLINSRGILGAILKAFAIREDLHPKVIRIIDKMSKISAAETVNQLKTIDIDQNTAEKMINFIKWGKTNEEKLEKVEINVPDSKPEVEKLKQVLAMLSSYGIESEVDVDFSLARGLDYYTGLVWEVVAEIDGKATPSIASGGRYDNLVGIYSKSPTPAVGSSLGLSRIFELTKNRAERKTFASVFMANIGKDTAPYAIEIAMKLRSLGVYVDMNVTERGISKQLDYSNSVGIKNVAIVGARERDAKKVNFRDMLTGTEELIDIDTLIMRLKK